MSGFEQRRADRDILASQANTFFNRPRSMADLEPQVPQGVEHEFDHALGMRCLLIGAKEQEIDVGKRRHCASPVATDRQ